MLQSLEHLCGPSLDSLQYLHVSLGVGNWRLVQFCYSFSLILLYSFAAMLR